jgi:hypothetical protein
MDGIKEDTFRGSGNAAVKSSCFLPVSLLTKGCAIKGRLLLQLGVGMKCAALDGFQCHVIMIIYTDICDMFLAVLFITSG